MQIVDILALLVPNIWTAITQLCATAVLFFALYKLAYKPVKKILDARLKDGSLVRFIVEGTYPARIDGVDAEELFEKLYYAG